MSFNPKIRFSSHKSKVNTHVEGKEYNCGLTEFLVTGFGHWLDPSMIRYMIIDCVVLDLMPKNVSTNEQKIWIMKEMEKLEEIWHTRLSTYKPFGLNVRGQSNFRRWVLPKLNKLEAERKNDGQEVDSTQSPNAASTSQGTSQSSIQPFIDLGDQANPSIESDTTTKDTGGFHSTVTDNSPIRTELIEPRRSQRTRKINKKYDGKCWDLH